MKKNNYYFGFIGLLSLLFLITSASAVPLNQKPEFKDFVNEMVTKYHFQRSYLQKIFANFKPDPVILGKIKHPYEGVAWEKYKQTFITKDRIAGGVRYWQKHQTALAYASKKYGVPSSIIVSIVGVETKYGTAKLKHSVFNALTTLSFYYPPRAVFFKKELREYLLLVRDLQVSPNKIKGSYAGAIGLPQFMPSNYRHVAVSANPPRKPDLMHDTNDVVFSIANFLHVAGWHADEPIATPANVLGERYHDTLFEKAEPCMTLEELKGYGVTAKHTFPKDYPAALIRFDRANDYEDWIVFHNFNVLRSYNTSDLYVMVVYQLAVKIKEARNELLCKAKKRCTN